jgi:rhodanese-related sulfurtransferase
MKNLISLCILLMIGVGCKNKANDQQNSPSYKDVDVATAQKMIAENNDLVILDVRTPEEVALGTIPNAIVIDYQASDFEDKISILKRSTPYLVYCRSGGRSVGASKKMIELGFKDVTNMEGGYNAWPK